ncbi:MAG: hypothetical protein ACYDBV_08335 [Nitrospiria bacterium]
MRKKIAGSGKRLPAINKENYFFFVFFAAAFFLAGAFFFTVANVNSPPFENIILPSAEPKTGKVFRA